MSFKSKDSHAAYMRDYRSEHRKPTVNPENRKPCVNPIKTEGVNPAESTDVQPAEKFVPVIEPVPMIDGRPATAEELRWPYYYGLKVPVKDPLAGAPSLGDESVPIWNRHKHQSGDVVRRWNDVFRRYEVVTL